MNTLETIEAPYQSDSTETVSQPRALSFLPANEPIDGEMLGIELFLGSNPVLQSQRVSREIKKAREYLELNGETIINPNLGRGKPVYIRVRIEEAEAVKKRFVAKEETDELKGYLPIESPVASEELKTLLFPGQKGKNVNQAMLRRIKSAREVLMLEGETIVDVRKNRRNGSIYIRRKLNEDTALQAKPEEITVPERILQNLPLGVIVSGENLARIVLDSASKTVNLSNRLGEIRSILAPQGETVINTTMGGNRRANYMRVAIKDIPGIKDAERKQTSLRKRVYELLPLDGYASFDDIKDLVNKSGIPKSMRYDVETLISGINENLETRGEVIINIAEIGEPVYHRATLEKGRRIEASVKRAKERAKRLKNWKKESKSDTYRISDFEFPEVTAGFMEPDEIYSVGG